MHGKRRIRALADLSIQGGLCLRLVTYWIICQAFVSLSIGFLLSVNTISLSADDWARLFFPVLGTAFLMSTLALPVALLDMIVFSNRFAGPWFRSRKWLSKMARGETVPELSFREKDVLTGLAQDINTIRRRLQEASLEQDRTDAADHEPVDQPPAHEPALAADQ